MSRRIVLFVLVALLSFACAQNPVLPFPNPTTACQQCANANGAPAQCTAAYNGAPGQFCYKFLSSGVTQACCCPSSAKCAPQTATQNVCQCSSVPAPIATPAVIVKKSISPWVWVGVAVGVLLLVFAIYWCCCRHTDELVEKEPVYVQPAYGQPVYVQQGYSGGDVAAGVAIGAAAGMVGGVAIGAALADGGHGEYHGEGYAVAPAAATEGGFSGGGDFAGDF
ncbi:hypothetical protein DYB32_009963 [Aphanomyces invadans]|uniref:Uncharacterized protein n=1 Tax=Aphanomyces invadans TaxID=157072 RepID=A0A3R6ZK36_9STRA|nr:hypothetical protein DYB32_009963 [Aphanomyces invadans]